MRLPIGQEILSYLIAVPILETDLIKLSKNYFVVHLPELISKVITGFELSQSKERRIIFSWEKYSNKITLKKASSCVIFCSVIILNNNLSSQH
jgi:hypothetical protein